MRKLSILLAFFTFALIAQEAPKPQETVKPAEAKPAEAKPAEAAKPQETKPQPPPPPVVKEVIFDKNVPKEADSIRICSFNIRTRGDKAPNDWQTRISRIHAILEKYELDSIGVQELTTQPSRTKAANIAASSTAKTASTAWTRARSGSPRRRMSSVPTPGRRPAAASAHGPN